MTEPDPDTVAQTVELYLSARQRFWRGIKGFLACFGIAALLGLLKNLWPAALAAVFVLTLAISMLIFWLMGAIATIQLQLIRCPSCRRRFWLSQYTSLTYEQCSRCLYVLKCIPSSPQKDAPLN